MGTRLLDSMFWDLWEKTLSKAPLDRVTRLASDLKAAGARLTVQHRGAAPVLLDIDDERKGPGVELALVHFLAMELAQQLVARDEEGVSYFTTPRPDTVLHEQGIRHDPHNCQHCDARRGY